MATAAPSLEALIQKATNPLNSFEDPNAIQAVCQAVTSEQGGIQTAVRLIAHKIQSPQEHESIQALMVLQACVNNCGPAFHSEVGKFRFLNEMIKLVSPRYLGNHTPEAVKKRVVELLYSWTLDLKMEPKILEAYNMLKKQGVVKDDPVYLGDQFPPKPKPRPPASFEDEEKSRMLQRLLQSKKPEDINKANALIKSMVKEDERRMERTSRRIIEVETAQNNVQLLDEMLTRHQENSKNTSSADLDLMAELNTSCSNLRSNIYRLVSEMDDKEDGIGDLLRVNDDLSKIMGRYVFVIEGAHVFENKQNAQNSKELASKKDSDILLDLSNPEVPSANTQVLNQDLQDLGLGSLTEPISTLKPETTLPTSSEPPVIDLMSTNSPVHTKTQSNDLMADLGNLVFSSATPVTTSTLSPLNSSPTLPLLQSPILPVTKSSLVSDTGGTSDATKSSNPLDDLDMLGSSLMKQSLPSKITMPAAFKQPEKVSMNQMKEQQKNTTINNHIQSLNPIMPIQDINACLKVDNNSNTKTNDVLADITPIILDNKIPAKEQNGTDCEPFKDLMDDISLIGISDPVGEKGDKTNVLQNKVEIGKTKTVELDKSEEGNLSNSIKNSKSNIQLGEVKPLTNLNVAWDEIKPGNQSPVVIIERSKIDVTLHFAQNRPREDVHVVVATTTSRNTQAIDKYSLQAVVPKGCKVKLLDPSSTTLAPFIPFLPPAAISQIMLIANPNQLNVSLKLILSYAIDDDPEVEMGEIASLPL